MVLPGCHGGGNYRRAIEELGISVNLITASTPIKERMQMLASHARGEVEAVVSVGVLAEGWDNPHCNLIVHMRPTLSKCYGDNLLAVVCELPKEKIAVWL